MKNNYIGCSGYYYKHWIGIFYPEDLPKQKWLPYYAEHFRTVEINSSFYHMPLDSSVINWYNITPSDFVFTLKGYRYITHLKKLIVDESVLQLLTDFQRKAYLLEEKLGCILWQLPASVKVNVQKLEDFCKILDTRIPQVFEFRHHSWFIPEVFSVLKAHNCSICMLSAPGNLPEMVYATSGVAYLRFHGKNGWYDDNYSNEQLDKWAEMLKSLKVSKLFAYFNNDFHGFAINNALYLESVVKAL